MDDNGLIYVYDRMVRKLYQYDKGGSILSSIDIDTTRGPKGPLHFNNNSIYFEDCDASHCGYFAIAKVLSNGSLTAVPYEQQEQDQSTLTLSGRCFKGKKFIEGYNFQMDIVERDGLSSKTVSLPFTSLLTRPFLGEDIKGNTYFSRAPVEYKYQLYEIDEFDRESNYLGTVKIPGGYQEFWAVKEFDLSKNGTIVNFIPGEKKLTMYIFTNENS